MEKPIYEIVPEYHKPWFGKGRVVYKLIMNYTYWDDPSYGNGGGDYREAKKVVETFYDEQLALDVMRLLNRGYE